MIAEHPEWIKLRIMMTEQRYGEKRGLIDKDRCLSFLPVVAADLGLVILSEEMVFSDKVICFICDYVSLEIIKRRNISNSMNQIMNSMISQNQTNFIKGQISVPKTMNIPKKAISEDLSVHFGSELFRHQIRNILGYGSGVFPQQSPSQQNKNTLDLILTVNSSDSFHQSNIRKNPNDYQGLSSIFGSKYVSSINSKVHPIHFNHINLNFGQATTTKVKYAVVSHSTFLQDLIDWNMLTLAGRLHKPVLPIKEIDSLDTQKAIYGNRRYALNIALLLMVKKGTISLEDLYRQIVELSYMGDIRFSFGVENTRKVLNIVAWNFNAFNQIYIPIIRELEGHSGGLVRFDPQRSLLHVKLEPKLLGILLSKGSIPRKIYMDLHSAFGKEGYNGTLAEQFLLLGVPEIKPQIEMEICSLNRKSSLKMAGNTLMSGGLLTNANYLLQKIRKKVNK